MIELGYKQEKNLADFELLLNLCINPKSARQMKKFIDYDYGTIRNKCNELVDLDYMTKEKTIAGDFNQKQWVYTTIKSQIDIDEFSHLLSLKKEVKGSKLSDFKIKIKNGEIETYHEPSLADGHYVHKVNQYEEKYKLQARQIHAEQKSPRVFVSGNSDLI